MAADFPPDDRAPRWAALRARLRGKRGPEYWRNLEELAETAEFRELVAGEFAAPLADAPSAVSRRDFLRVMAASMALAGLTGCGRPLEPILPYSYATGQIVPGKPLFYATAMTMAGAAMGVLVKTREGRPIKIEGNPRHPASLGATDAFSQASVLTLYDPDRSQAITRRGQIVPWNALSAELRAQAERQRLKRGAGLRILTEAVVSPTLGAQLQALLRELPEARWVQYEPVSRDYTLQGVALAFGRRLRPIYNLANADVILALDYDFLAEGTGWVRYALEFAERRQPSLGGGGPGMSRLYVAEPTPSITGAKADHRIVVHASDLEAFTRSLAGAVQGRAVENTPYAPWITAAASDLVRHRGRAVVMAGFHLPPPLQAMAHVMNHALGAIGSTVSYLDPGEAAAPGQSGDPLQDLRGLVAEMQSGAVEWLLLVGANPVYTAPADIDFPAALRKVTTRMHLGLYADETAAACDWHIPEAHYIEAWGDARAFDGTASIVQPAIRPLWGGVSAIEFLGAVNQALHPDQPQRSGYEMVREYWRAHSLERAARSSEAAFEAFWRQSLNDGVLAGTEFATVAPASLVVAPLTAGSAAQAAPPSATRPTDAGESARAADAFEVLFRPDPAVFDGRFANNGWMQELPKPITRLMWENAALLSLEAAEQLGVGYDVAATGGERGQVWADVIEIEAGGRRLRAPAWIVPGQAARSITLTLGYGRTRAGRVGNALGVNAYRLRTADDPYWMAGAKIRKTGERARLACAQFHHAMEGRETVRAATLEEFARDPGLFRDAPSRAASGGVGGHSEPAASLYPEYDYSQRYAWGMSIDTQTCIGCNACVVACQAENNIPVVGRTEAMRARTMHWIRIDTYFSGQLENPQTYFQPVPCMQCENAPCEVVCPVNATVHSAEGLNDMVYNRCVGTRYCSNNCPYKVRRFNFFQYADWETPSLKLLRNPEVTVRSRGVMEKCTYCVQRITAARIEAEKEGRLIGDGELQTACQQVCPARAIVFGNVNQRTSLVARLKAGARDYPLLGDLNTRPRTTYLATVRNPNPEMPPSQERSLG